MIEIQNEARESGSAQAALMPENRIFTEKVEGNSVLLAGESWCYRVWSRGDDELNLHTKNSQIRSVRRTKDGYWWEFAWLIYREPGNLESDCFIPRRHGKVATLEEAAQAAMDYRPEPIEIAGATWYPHNEDAYLSMVTGWLEAEIRPDENGWRWKLEYPLVGQISGYSPGFDGPCLKGYAVSLADAAQAIKDAPAVFRNSLRVVLEQAATGAC